jgi:hypothetical protein
LRKLEEQRSQRLGHRVQVAEGQQPVRVADGAASQGVQPFITAPLMPVHMTGRVEPNRSPSAPVRMHPQDRLLSHGSAGEEDRPGLAQQ